jgi:hypothetical protein
LVCAGTVSGTDRCGPYRDLLVKPREGRQDAEGVPHLDFRRPWLYARKVASVQGWHRSVASAELRNSSRNRVATVGAGRLDCGEKDVWFRVI